MYISRKRITGQCTRRTFDLNTETDVLNALQYSNIVPGIQKHCINETPNKPEQTRMCGPRRDQILTMQHASQALPSVLLQYNNPVVGT